MNIKARAPTTFTSREFNQDTARAKRAAQKGPVIITTRGQPSHVLLSIEDYRRLDRREPKSLAEALADTSKDGDFDYDFPEFKGISKGFEFD
jgi:prevent-host-death family protein